MDKIWNKKTEIVWNKKEKILENEGESLLKYSLQIPILRNEQRLIRRINRFYERTAQVWERRWTGRCRELAEAAQKQCRERGIPFETWTAELSGAVSYMDDMLFSVRMEAKERRGNGRVSQVRWGDVWKLDEGAPCGIRELTTSSRRELFAEIVRQGRERSREGTCFLDVDWEEKAARLMGTLSPCLTEEGLEYYFPQASIAPAAEGVLCFTVSNIPSD